MSIWYLVRKGNYVNVEYSIVGSYEHTKGTTNTSKMFEPPWQAHKEILVTAELIYLCYADGWDAGWAVKGEPIFTFFNKPTQQDIDDNPELFL